MHSRSTGNCPKCKTRIILSHDQQHTGKVYIAVAHMSITRLLAAMNLLHTMFTLAWSTHAPISSALVPMDAPSPPAKSCARLFKFRSPLLCLHLALLCCRVWFYMSLLCASFVRLHVGVGSCHMIHHFVRVVSLASSIVIYTNIIIIVLQKAYKLCTHYLYFVLLKYTVCDFAVDWST